MATFWMCQGCKKYFEPAKVSGFVTCPYPDCKKSDLVNPDYLKKGDLVVCKCKKSVFPRTPGALYPCAECKTNLELNEAGTLVAATSLLNYGSLLMAFEQGQLLRGQFTEEQRKKLNVEKGACRGFCFQWVRRMLLSDKEMSSRVKYKEEKLPQKVNRGVLAQVAESTLGFEKGMSEVDSRRLKSKPTSTNLFKNIELKDPVKKRDSKVREVVLEVCISDSLQPSLSCAIFGASSGEGVVGHVVAIYKQPGGVKYYLFEPNQGIYDVSTAENLANGIEWVFCKDQRGPKLDTGKAYCYYEIYMKKK